MSNISCYDSDGNLLETFYQWDHNQTITINGIDLQASYAFHYCNRLSKEALVVSPTKTEHGFTARVPNILLQQPESIVVYLYLISGNEEYRTEHSVYIPVVPRAKPSDYEYDDESEYISIAELDEELKALISRVDEMEDFILPGGTTGQVLKKLSNDDFDVEWADESGGGSADAVTYTEQTLTDTQKEQARENIDTDKSGTEWHEIDLSRYTMAVGTIKTRDGTDNDDSTRLKTKCLIYVCKGTKILFANDDPTHTLTVHIYDASSEPRGYTWQKYVSNVTEYVIDHDCFIRFVFLNGNSNVTTETYTEFLSSTRALSPKSPIHQPEGDTLPYFRNEIKDTAEAVNKEAGAKLLIFTDIHCFYPVWGEPYHLSWGHFRNIKTVAEETHVDAVVCLGDMTMGYTFGSNTKDTHAMISRWSKSLPAPYLQCEGNHDANYRYAFGGSVGRYNEIVTPEELSNYYSHPNDLYHRQYFYHDIPEKKTRVIVLNANDAYVLDGNGNPKYNKEEPVDGGAAATYAFMPQQIEWLAQLLHDTERDCAGWDVVVCSHQSVCPTGSGATQIPKNTAIVWGLLTAFNGGTSYTGSTSDGDFTVSVDETYDGVCQIPVTFYGHKHYDRAFQEDGIWCVCVPSSFCDMPNTSDSGATVPTRTAYTASEDAWDVACITDEKVKLIRFGAGNDRTLERDEPSAEYYGDGTNFIQKPDSANVDDCLVFDGEKWIASASGGGGGGQPGFSPTITVTTITGGHRLTITDVNGTRTVDVMDGTPGSPGVAGKGISSISKTGTSGLVDTYTISYTDNTTSTFTVTNGANGTSAAWFTGTAVTGTGSSISATVSGSKAGDMYLNTSTLNVYSATTANVWAYKCNIKGTPGATPTKGVDYFTDAEIADIVDEAATQVDALPSSTKYADAYVQGGAAKKALGVPFGKVDSTSTATAFTATIQGVTELYHGLRIMLTNGVVTSAAGCTLNINNLGAKPIYQTMAAATAVTTTFNVNYTMEFTYNTERVSGGCWDMSYGYYKDTTYSNVSLGCGYTTCSTAAATAAKTASLSSYALTANGRVSVKFTNSVPANATLNINSKGAKAIYYKGAPITDGIIEAGDTVTFVYSTYYHITAIDRVVHDGADGNKTYICTNFDSAETYAVGDYVMYSSALYECTTAHTGAWNASHFTAVTLNEGDLICNTDENSSVAWSDITGKPTIPTAVSQLTNDSGYQTAAQVTAAINSALGVIENGSY